MIKPDYWNIKPHTERKLDILNKYLNSWCDILFKYYQRNPTWVTWKTPFFVDCFSGRGMYHKGGKLNSVKGSPIIAIEKLIEKKQFFEEKYKIQISPKVRLIEYIPEYAKELEIFITPYRKHLDIRVLCGDFNDHIGGIVSETGYSPTFFFVDAGGIKELRKESVEKIITKKGARDILLNYVVDGQIRIGGLAQSIFDGSYKGKQFEGAFKTIERLEDFTGMEIVKFLDETNNDYREALTSYVDNVLHANNKLLNSQDRLQTIVYDMKDTRRQKLVYYLLFSSRKSVATDIMKSIFKNSKSKETNQTSLFPPEIREIKK
jgi:three-Cys-motif partner protein